jgi:DNA-3-methyladenine glycosylase
MTGPADPADPFARPVVDLARALVGATLLVDGVGGVIVETEAYARHDAASHSCRGPTPRNRAMFGPAGRAYVYRSYGIHWCFNVVGGGEPGCAVLVRALEPTQGLDRMRARRRLDDPRLLCAGPGRFAQALGLDASHDGLDLGRPPFALSFGAEVPAPLVGPRIGISRNADAPWRFGLPGSRCLSKPFPRAARDEKTF